MTRIRHDSDPERGIDAADRPLRALLNRPRARVTRLDWQGRAIWLKRPELPSSLRWRLQKGDPVQAFRRELSGLAGLAAAGMPVPQVLDQGPDFLFLADAGPTLDAVLADPATASDAAAVQAAAGALAALHSQGMAHGRPYLRDLCWDGTRITMIDFERYRPRAGALRQGADLVMFLGSLLAQPDGAPLLAGAVAAYRKAAPEAALRGARFWLAQLVPLAPLARLVCRLKPHNREIAGYLRLIEARAMLR